MLKEKNIKIGLGITVIGILAFTVNYIMKQVRMLVNSKFEMVGTKINKLSLKEISLTLWWKLINKSDISITVSEQKYDIYLNGKFIKTVGNNSSTKIKAHSDNRIPTYVIFSPKDVLGIGLVNMSKFLTKEGRETLNLQVRGTMNISTSIFEIKKLHFEFDDTIESIMNY